MKNENKILKQQNKSYLKIIELLSVDIPLRNYGNFHPAQASIINQDHSIASDLSAWNFLSNYDCGSNNHIHQRSNANAINANKRPDICITERYVNTFTPTTVPGNSTNGHGHKICVVGDSHIKRIKRNDFNKELHHGKAFFCLFSGANAK